MNDSGTYSNETFKLTVMKFILNGKTNRVLIKSSEGNYFLDFSVHSFLERSILNTSIFIVKIVSLVVSALQIDVNKIIN